MIRLVSAFAFRLGWVRIAWVVVGAETCATWRYALRDAVGSVM